MVQAFYRELLPVVNQAAFHRGEWKLKEVLDDGHGSRIADCVPYRDLRSDVDTAGRLVEDQDFRVRHQPFRQHDLLLVAAGQRRGPGGGIARAHGELDHARGGQSNHNFGIAFDVTIFTGSSDPEKAKTPVYESPVYKAIGALGTDLGLEWGGNWKTIVDEPHFQLRPGWAADLSESDMLADLRKRKDTGKEFFA